MKAGFPVIRDEGTDSRIYGHFASAPIFLSVDTETGEVVSFENCDQQNPLAGCNPFKALTGKGLDNMIVSGIGDGFLELLNMMGMVVYQAETEIVGENIDLLKKDALQQLDVQNSAEEGRCEDAGEHGCSHDHADHSH